MCCIRAYFLPIMRQFFSCTLPRIIWFVRLTRMRYFLPFSFALAMLTLLGCSKVLDSSTIKLDEPTLVVNAIVGNDTTMIVYVTRSYNIVGKQPTYADIVLRDAQVKIYQNDTLWATPVFMDVKQAVDNNNNVIWGRLGYFCDSTLRVKPGATYKIEVTHAKYGKATSTTTIPSSVTLESISIKQKALINENQQNLAKISIRVKTGTTLPYAWGIAITGYTTIKTGDSSITYPFPVYVDENATTTGTFTMGNTIPGFTKYYSGTTPYFSTRFSGGTQSETYFAPLIDFSLGSPNKDTLAIDSFRVELWSCDRPVFEYMTRYLAHVNAQNGGFPLFEGEPFPMYNNITGGYGIWGGYQYSVKTIKR